MTTTLSSYDQRLQTLHQAKLRHVQCKLELAGPRDADEQGNIPLPADLGKLVEAVSGSGVRVRDVVLKDFIPTPNHPSGGFFGPKACGENFRRLLDLHPTYIHPANSMAGVYMTNFMSYRAPAWNPDFDYSHLQQRQRLYGIDSGIGGVQHFCPDLSIGLELGWGGLLRKVRTFRAANTETGTGDFYDGLENIVRGAQDWIARHAADARALAVSEPDPQLHQNLLSIAAICERLVTVPPSTFREACQFLVFFQAIAKMYNGSGEWGQLDELLRPYYERDIAAGILDDEEAIFHLACLLLSETAYIQLGGPAADGHDQTSRVSFLLLEAAHRLKVPANIGIRVGGNVSPELLQRSLEILFQDRLGIPKFIGDDAVIAGFMRSGYPLALARTRTYAGCHWLAIPGREYGMADLIKIDFAQVFDVAFREMMADTETEPSTAELWRRFEAHLSCAVEVVAQGIDVHFAHMHEVFPELVLDLFCHGPLETGRDASHGGVDFYNIGVDGASLATVADSFAAIEQRVEHEHRFTWHEIAAHLESNWAGPDGERARLLMRHLPRFGSGDSLADDWALRLSRTFTDIVCKRPTPNGFKMIPGLFSWAKVIEFGKRLRATPNGRKAGEPVSHGPNPEPGCNSGDPGTPTQLALAVARVQCGLGNTCPLQLDLDPGLASEENLPKIAALLRAHFDLGGTMVNLNIIDKATLLDAWAHPGKYPDLIVRVTGFSAYFSSLSEDLRQYVVDRLVNGG